MNAVVTNALEDLQRRIGLLDSGQRVATPRDRYIEVQDSASLPTFRSSAMTANVVAAVGRTVTNRASSPPTTATLSSPGSGRLKRRAPSPLSTNRDHETTQHRATIRTTESAGIRPRTTDGQPTSGGGDAAGAAGCGSRSGKSLPVQRPRQPLHKKRKQKKKPSSVIPKEYRKADKASFKKFRLAVRACLCLLDEYGVQMVVQLGGWILGWMDTQTSIELIVVPWSVRTIPATGLLL